jgi:hypothetical protein
LWAQIANYHTAHTAVVTMPLAAVILLGLAAAIWIAACDDFAPKALFRVALASFVLSVLAAAPILIGGAHEILMTDHFLWSFFTASAVFALPIIYVARLGIPQLAHSGIVELLGPVIDVCPGTAPSPRRLPLPRRGERFVSLLCTSGGQHSAGDRTRHRVGLS